MKNTQEEVAESLQNGEMTYVEYISQLDDDVLKEYEQYCKDKGLDSAEEDSAISFIEYRENELDASMDN